MKNIILAVLALFLLAACGKPTTVGTDLDKAYNINLTVQNNIGAVTVLVPVTVAADSVNRADQDTDQRTDIDPTTDVKASGIPSL